MSESDFYNWFRKRLTAMDISVNKTVRRDMILYLVGTYGLEILANARYITPTANHDIYRLNCEID